MHGASSRFPACGFHVPAADDQIDPDAPVVPTGDWWDASYAYRKQIIVTTTTAAIDKQYSVVFAADTAALVSGGHARTNAKDWRVVRHIGDHLWTELDRWIDDVEGTQWDSADTRTWFQLPAAVAASATDAETYVYYGAQSGNTPPEDLDRVFLFADDFRATSASGSRTASARS